MTIVGSGADWVVVQFGFPQTSIMSRPVGNSGHGKSKKRTGLDSYSGIHGVVIAAIGKTKP